MRLRALPVLTAAIAAAIVGTTVTAVPAAAAAPTDFFSMTSDDRPQPSGPTGTLVAGDQQVALVSPTPSRFKVTGSPTAPAGLMSLTFVAPNGTAFAAPATGQTSRTYDLDSVPSPAEAGASAIFGSASSCQVATGTLSILRLTTAGSGITVVEADYDLTCAGGTRLYGQFSVGTGRAYPGSAFATGYGPRDLGALPVGREKQVAVDFTYTGPDVAANFTIGPFGDDVDELSVVSNSCNGGQQLSDGQTCTVTVALTPRDVGTRGFTLTVGDNDALAGVVFGAYDPDAGTYHAVEPERLLDTRDGTGGFGIPVGAGESLPLSIPDAVANKAGTAVLNLTVTNPTVAGYVTAYADGGARPATSSINFIVGQTVANLVTVPIAANGKVLFYNAFGRTDLVVDYIGWYAAKDSAAARTGGGFHPTLSQRGLDTRSWGYGKLQPGSYATMSVRYPNDGGHIAAFSVNVTATNTEAEGYVTTWNAATDTPPFVSTLNFQAGQTVPNAAIVPTTYCPAQDSCSDYATIGVYNGSTRPIDVLADVNGYYDDGNLTAAVRYQPLAEPTRVVDTRTGQGGLAQFGSDQTQTLLPPTTVAGYDTYALDSNVTGLALDAGTFVTGWAGGYSDYPRPDTSIINATRGQVVANHATTSVGSGNRVNYYNLAGRLDLVLDVNGTFESFPPTPLDQQQGKQARPAVAVPAPTIGAARPHTAR